MIEELETSPTSKAKCTNCGTAIQKGDLRGKEFDSRFGSYHYFCKNCSYKQIISNIITQNKMKQDLEAAGTNLLS